MLRDLSSGRSDNAKKLQKMVRNVFEEWSLNDQEMVQKWSGTCTENAGKLNKHGYGSVRKMVQKLSTMRKQKRKVLKSDQKDSQGSVFPLCSHIVEVVFHVNPEN